MRSYYWKRKELDYDDKRGEARLKSSNKFASLPIQLQLVPSSEEESLNKALENASAGIAEDIYVHCGLRRQEKWMPLNH